MVLYFVLYGIGSPWVDRNDFCITVGLDCSVQQVNPLFFLLSRAPCWYMYWSRVLVCLAEHSSSARDHVGNFPTDIETSSLPAACHGYYQIHRCTAVVRRGICCLQGDRVAASYGNSGTKHLFWGSWWFLFNRKNRHFHPTVISRPTEAPAVVFLFLSIW